MSDYKQPDLFDEIKAARSSFQPQLHMKSSFYNLMFSVHLALAGMLGVSQPTLAANGKFVNLSIRTMVGTGEEVIIGGFIIEDDPLQVLIQAIGPELAERGIANALPDPVLTVSGGFFNDDWEDTQGQLISDLWGGNPPLTPGSLSSAAVLTLNPGAHTVKIQGRNGTKNGVVLVEFYKIDSPDVDPPPPGASSDRDVLEIFYNATNGQNWTYNYNWLTDAPLAGWYGIQTDSSGQVISIIFEENDLSGSIPPELGNLTNLQTLVIFEENDLSGPIPPELGNLANLQTLDLRHTGLSGSIPAELGNLANLQRLYLSSNRLSGSIPPELGNLANLQRLDFSWNGLSGPIPPELGNLANLQRLNLSSSQLSREIPPELGNLANLQRLNLSSSQLSGEIPPELGNLSNLERLDLSGSHLSGSIPAELGNLANLQRLDLSWNDDLSGSIPAEFVNLANLETLNLRFTMICVPDNATLQAFLSNFAPLPACE